MSHAFVTGATGLIGRWLVPELVRRGSQVTVLLRNARERSAEYLQWVASHGADATAVRVVDGDLASPGLGLSEADRVHLATLTDVFHAGALMKWRMARDVAKAANVDGTQAVVDLALASRALRRFVHVGGFKAATAEAWTSRGIAHDAPFDHALYEGLYNRLGGYEASKLAADHLVRDAARTRGLPLTQVHPGGVIGDSCTGETTQFFGFAPLVQDLWYGKLPAVPGGRRTWLPLTTVDFLASFMARLPELADTAGGSYTVLDERTPLLVDLVALIGERIGVAAPRRRVPISIVKRVMRSRREELSFLSDERHDTQATVAIAARMNLAWPSITDALHRNIDFIIASRFGAQPVHADAGLDRIAGSQTFVTGTTTSPDRVLLHGLPLDSDSWDALDQQLGGSSLRADLPGLGRSAPAAATPAEWTSSLLRSVARPTMVVAHSLGTLYAIEYAVAHPERVEALVLVSPFFLQAPPPSMMRWAPAARSVGRLLRRKHIEQLVAGDAHATTPVLDGPATHLARPGAGARFGEALAFAHARRKSLQQALAELATRIPIVIIHGERDALVDAAPSGVRVVTLPGTGHFPQLDQPAAVAAVIRELASATHARAA
ncbi:MAG TPA: alpha/beta fold hydrolase [Kofleriaceae bacterium]|nr:alpha/beta fold hydrolase [Kofleriaceae bacterium]